MIRGWIFLALLFFGALVANPSHAEELRAAWVASVFNLNFPSRPGLSAAAQRGEIARLVNGAADAGLNALFVQVRPEGDALYPSSLEPWSRFLTGRPGGDPGFDPLATFIAEGKRRGIAIHAWLNPYRASTNAASLAPGHFASKQPGLARRVGRQLWFDPGELAVRAQVVRVAEDLCRRYPLAGIVLDDYFYPYPNTGLPRGTFPDDATYARYQAGGGTLARADWRRENVHLLLRDLQRVVHAARPGATFGVSPFGIYRPRVPATVEAQLDQFAELYADPVRWMREGVVDWLSPQLYWPDAGPQSFSALLRWWRSPEANPRGVPIYPSLALKYSPAEIERQLALEQSIGPRPAGGWAAWSVGPLLKGAGYSAVTARRARAGQ